MAWEFARVLDGKLPLTPADWRAVGAALVSRLEAGAAEIVLRTSSGKENEPKQCKFRFCNDPIDMQGESDYGNPLLVYRCGDVLACFRKARDYRCNLEFETLLADDDKEDVLKVVIRAECNDDADFRLLGIAAPVDRCSNLCWLKNWIRSHVPDFTPASRVIFDNYEHESPTTSIGTLFERRRKRQRAAERSP